MNVQISARHKQKVTQCLALLCFACVLSFFILVYTGHSGQSLSGQIQHSGRTAQWTNLSPVLENDETKNGKELTPITPCAPAGEYDQYNPCLIKYVQQNLLMPPSGLPYQQPKHKIMKNGVEEKVGFIKKHFMTKNSPPGFFIECGANDGTFISPTLKLEQEFNWTGVLIEADPTPFKELLSLHRNAWKMNAALCTSPNSKMVTFYSRPKFSPIGGLLPGKDTKEVVVPCIPLYTVLAAMGITTVDFFSLDVEGVELDVLNTVPYDKIMFKVLIVEHNHVPGYQPAMIDLMEPKGYKFIGSMLGHSVEDSVFVHESVYTSDMSLKIKYDKRFTRKPNKAKKQK